MKIFQTEFRPNAGLQPNPILFNLYIDNNILNNEEFKECHSPVIMNKEIHGLLFADDVLISSITKTGNMPAGLENGSVSRKESSWKKDVLNLLQVV